MVREAEQHSDEDRRRREEIELRNNADSLAYTAERTLGEQGDKVPADVRDEVTSKVAAVRSALQSGDVTSIRSATEELSRSVQRIGQSVYGAGAGAAGEGGPTGGASETKGPEGTVEGEFREV